MDTCAQCESYAPGEGLCLGYFVILHGLKSHLLHHYNPLNVNACKKNKTPLFVNKNPYLVNSDGDVDLNIKININVTVDVIIDVIVV